MAKDPAFLFYPSDFLTGTIFMTNEEVGMYIRLLCAQHQQGRLSEKHMLSICESYTEEVFSKFKKDSMGLYYNDRLEHEMQRRAKYTQSRRDNAKGKGKTKLKNGKAYAKHMETITINENINKGEIKKEKENQFRKEAVKFKEQYGEEMIKEFCDYWTESNPKGIKLKFELQKTFDISRRLVTWSNNNFSKTGKHKSEHQTPKSIPKPIKQDYR